MVLLFASVLVHELAHGLMARARGQQPREFVLTLWGGHTAFGGATPTPASSALIAVVGPIANLVLAAGFLAVAQGVETNSLVGLLVWSGCLTNAFVGLFNLVPGLPLDGGFLLEAAVWAVTKNRHTGTVGGRVGGPRGRRRRVRLGARAAARAGPPAGDLRRRLGRAHRRVPLVGRLRGGPRRPHPEGRRPHHASPPSAAGRRGSGTPSPSRTPRPLAAAAGAEEVVILSPDGRPAAYVDRAAAASVPADAAGTTPVTAVAVPLPGGAVVDGLLTGQQLVAAVGRATEHSPVVVAVVDGRVVGLIRAMDVVAAIRS